MNGGANSGTRKRHKSSSIYNGLRLKHVGMDSKVLKSVSKWFAWEKAELCIFDSLDRRLWSRWGRDVSCNGAVFSFSAVVASFPSDFIARSEKYNHSSFMSGSNFLIEILHHKMAAD